MPDTTSLLEIHCVWPGEDCEPLAQGLQTEAPLLWPNVSAGQGEQAVEPEVALNEPVGHAAQEM